MQTLIPSLDLDPFGEDFLAAPYAYHTKIRDAGPVVWFDKYGVFGMARHADVHAALMDWQTFSSARGVGIDDLSRDSSRLLQPPTLVEEDPPNHPLPRSTLARIVSGKGIRQLRGPFEEKAEALADSLVAKGSFDAITELAEIYPISVLPDAVGMQKEGREALLPFGNLVFNAFGPRNALYEQAVKEAEPVMEWAGKQRQRSVVSKDGLGAQIYAEADAGKIPEDMAERLVGTFVQAGIDTTVSALGSVMLAVSSNPEQWTLLRDDPKLIRPAFDEVLRWESPVQAFFRTTTRDVDVEGLTIPKDSKVLMFFGAANRDPRRWENADKFDVLRNPVGHLAFGTGIHGCIGQMIARLEAELIMSAFAKRVARFDILGTPKRKLNNTMRGLSSLPVKVTAA